MINRSNLGALLARAGNSLLTTIVLCALMQSASAQAVFINEIHYDNTGSDSGEAIEIAGPAGTDLTGWSIVRYNGNGGGPYGTTVLADVISDQQGGFGTVITTFPSNGLQNGAPDGIALVDPSSTVVQFLSYEGSFTAVGGPANGITSTDIGVSESSGTPVGSSLQLVGTGSDYADFAWAIPAPNTYAAPNTGQTFSGGGVFVNEIHYDNTGSDSGEAIEIAGPAGTDLTGWSIVRYNGNGGGSYGTTALAGVISNQQGGFGTVVTTFPSNGLQNGSPDGIALVDPGSTVIQFLSYEGSFTATDGPANGMMSVDIGVSESSGTPVGHSLQLVGSGINYEDFAWSIPAPNTFGAPNTGQTFTGSGPQIIINEVDADTAGTDVLEFVELYDGGAGNTPLDGLVVVLYNGNGDVSYNSFDLDGFVTNGDGYFLLGNAGVVPTPGIIFPSNGLQNGADAVALYEGDATDFLSGTPVTDVNLVDAIVYDTNDADDLGLLSVLLNPGQPQANEGSRGSSGDHSNQRCPNGSGGSRNTITYEQFAPTAGMDNVCIDPPRMLKIHEVQGSGLASPEVGNTVIIEGIVVGDFQDGVSNVEVFVNEVHYDNVGSDVGEAIEIAGTAGTDLTGWSLVLYNGNSGAPYNTLALAGTIADQQGGFGTVVLPVNGLQNGAPDGIALVDPGAAVVQFLSYEGSFVAVGGPANGMTSTDIGVSESSGTPVGNSLQLSGTGASYASFAWSVDSPNTFGLPNTGQTFAGGTASGANGDLDGFFVQEEDADADADPQTSEGIFVFDDSSPAVDVAIGDLVRVEGTVSEFFGLTEITSRTGVTVISQGNPLPTAATVTLPVTSLDDYEPFEGMAVTFPQSLVISDYFNFDRFGEIVLTSTRHLTPTAEFEPGSAAQQQAAQDFPLDAIVLDDGRTTQNPDPAIHPNGLEFDLTNLFRGGDTVQDVSGVMSYSFSAYRIQPTQGANYFNDNPRPNQPDPVGGSVTVASFNVLNYFSTLDDSGAICGPLQNVGCRGADDADEFTRQRDKIFSALIEMDADVVGLIEIENHLTDNALIDLVDGLNAATAPGTYDYVPSGVIGADVIKVALIYQPATVSLVGDFAILDASVDARFNDDENRPVLAQSFRDSSTGGVFTVAVNHLKSKGSNCDALGDPDTGDGSGNCNLTRTSAAEALVDWLAGDPTGSGRDNSLIIGDLNAYDKEDPIDAILAGGYVDLIDSFLGEDAYSFVFGGQTGYLDHALANPGLDAAVTGVTVWHINADEPDLINYDTSFKGPEQDAIYAPDAFRSSDHDPIIIGLNVPADVLPPVGVFGRGKGDKVNLTWTDAGADSYDVYRSDTSGGPYDFIGSTANNVYVDSPVVPGNTYYYVVVSVLGVATSGPSDEARVDVPAGRRRR